MILQTQLKTLLKQNDLTVAQLSRACGISAKTLFNWLQGQPPRAIPQVKTVADYFKVSLDFMCYGISPAAKDMPILGEIHAGKYEVVLRKIKEE